MLPSSPDRMPRARAERMVAARVIIAVGLALLMVVGAWSTSRGSADVHMTRCLAAGVSAPAGAAPSERGSDDVTAIDVLASDVGICVLAVLGGVALALLLGRLRKDGTRPLGTGAPRLVPPSRAGPTVFIPAPSLTQLSISRT